MPDLSPGNPLASMLSGGNQSPNTGQNTPLSPGNPIDTIINSNNQPYNSMVDSGGTSIKQGTLWDAIDIMNRNFANIANGSLQAGAQALQAIGIDTTSFQKNLANQQAVHQRDYQAAMHNSPIVGAITDVGSKLGSALSTPGAQPFMAMSAPSILGGIGQTAIGSGIMGGSEYVNPNQSRFSNAMDSAVLGAAGQGILEGAGSLAQKGISSLFNTPIQEAASTADKGLLTTVGSATGNPLLQGVEDTLGKIPIVGSRGRIMQQVGNLQDETQNVLDNIGVGSQSRVELGDDLNQAIKSAYQKATMNTNEAYGTAMNIAKDNNLSIPLTESQSSAQDALNQLNTLKEAGINSINPGANKAGQLLQDISNLPNNRISADLFDTLRRKIGATIDNLSKGNDEEGLLPYLQKIKGSMDEDLQSAGSQSQEFGDALLNARNIFMQQKAPFQNIPELAKSLSGKIDTDQLLNQIVKNDRPELTNSIMQVLTPEGQQSFTRAIIGRALNNSIVDDASAAGSHIDLNAFNNQLNKLGDTLTALPSDQQNMIQGLQRLLTRGSQLIKTSEASPNNLGSWIAGGSILHSILTGGTADGALLAGGAKALSYTLTSPTVTKALIKIGGGKLAQTGEDGLIKSTLKTMSKGVVPAISSNYGAQ